MNLLFLTICDINDINAHGVYEDLMREFISHGHKVYVVSPNEQQHAENTKLISGPNWQILKVKAGNISMASAMEANVSIWMLEGQYSAAIQSCFSDVKFDLVLCSAPPHALTKVISYIKKRDGAKIYLMLKDFYPQSEVDTGWLLPKTRNYRVAQKKARNLYKVSDRIGCASRAAVDCLCREDPKLKSEKVGVCINALTAADIAQPDRHALRDKWELPQDAAVFFIGQELCQTMGSTFLTDVLRANRAKTDRFFVICGAGTEYEDIEEFVQEMQQEDSANVKLFTGLAKDQYRELLAASDVGMVFLDRRLSYPLTPDCVLSYMEYEKPVFAAANECSDLKGQITDGGFGWYCLSGEEETCTRMLDEICKSSDIAEKGKKARIYLENNCNTQIAYQQIIESL